METIEEMMDLNDPVFETPELPKLDRIRLAKKTDRLRRKVRENYYLRLLEDNNIFYRFLAYFYRTDFAQRGILRIKFIKRLSDFLKSLLFKSHVRKAYNAL